jgi:serine/threonine protein kinase
MEKSGQIFGPDLDSGLKFKNAAYLGSGEYGSVFKVRTTDDRYGRDQQYVAVKLGVRENTSSSSVFANEMNNSALVYEAVVEKRLSPFVHVPMKGEVLHVLNESGIPPGLETLAAKSQDVARLVEGAKKGLHMILYVQVSLLVEGGDLMWFLLEHRNKSRKVIPRNWITSISYQILQALFSLMRGCGIRHQDAKPENLLVIHHERHRTDLSLYSSPDRCDSLTLSPRHCPVQVLLSDFGISQKVGETAVRPNKRYRPLLPHLLQGDALGEYESTDIWALGIQVIDLCLVGWTPPIRTLHSLDNHLVPQRYGKESLLDTSRRSLELLRWSSEVLASVNGNGEIPYYFLLYKNRQDTPPSHSFKDKDGVSTVCRTAFLWLLKDELDKSGDPATDPEIPNASLNQLYRAMASRIRETRAFFTVEGTYLIGAIAGEVRNRLGDSGVQFVSRCLAWSHCQRTKFGARFCASHDDEREKLIQMYELATRSDFFEEFRVSSHSHYGFTK